MRHPRALQFVARASFGVAADSGGRATQDDRATAFSARLQDGNRITVAAVLDGHHGHALADLVVERLPKVFLAAVTHAPPGDLSTALVSSVHWIAYPIRSRTYIYIYIGHRVSV